MSRTRRDHPSIKRWWETHDCGVSPWRCNHCPDPFPRGERIVGPVPSWWNKEQRQAERNRLKTQLREVRDWDEIPTGDGRQYRRPWYW